VFFLHINLVWYIYCISTFGPPCITYIWYISHSKKNWARYCQKCTYIGLHVKCRHSCQILIKLEFSRQTFEKMYIYIYIYIYIQISNFMKIRQVFIPCGRIDRDRHDDANSRFSQLRTRQKKVCICILYNSNKKCLNRSIVLYRTFNNKQQSGRESAQIAQFEHLNKKKSFEHNSYVSLGAVT